MYKFAYTFHKNKNHGHIEYYRVCHGGVDCGFLEAVGEILRRLPVGGFKRQQRYDERRDVAQVMAGVRQQTHRRCSEPENAFDYNIDCIEPDTYEQSTAKTFFAA